MASFWNMMQLYTFLVWNVARGQLLVNKTKTIHHVTKKMHLHFLYALAILVLRDVINVVFFVYWTKKKWSDNDIKTVLLNNVFALQFMRCQKSPA